MSSIFSTINIWFDHVQMWKQQHHVSIIIMMPYMSLSQIQNLTFFVMVQTWLLPKKREFRPSGSSRNIIQSILVHKLGNFNWSNSHIIHWYLLSNRKIVVLPTAICWPRKIEKILTFKYCIEFGEMELNEDTHSTSYQSNQIK